MYESEEHLGQWRQDDRDRYEADMWAEWLDYRTDQYLERLRERGDWPCVRPQDMQQ